MAHNYRREHALNMWFVIARDSGTGRCGDRAHQALTQLVYAFPKEREFFVELRLPLLEGQGAPEPAAARLARATSAGAAPFDATDFDRTPIAATQGGLPLVPRPYDELAEALGVSAGLVLDRLQRMLSHGLIRRIGAVPNHYRLGFTANGMSVWDVDDAEVDRLGERVGALPGVSHCYRRPRATGVWPYNLFAMLHGRSRAEVEAQAERLRELLGPACRAHDILLLQRHPQEDRIASGPAGCSGRKLKTMFRITQYMRELAQAQASGSYPCLSRPGRQRAPRPPARIHRVRSAQRAAGVHARGPVVIWNLIRRCNLTCKHCYAQSADHEYAGELGTQEVFSTLEDLKAAGVPALILSGGEPLRPDFFEIAQHAKELGFHVSLEQRHADRRADGRPHRGLRLRLCRHQPRRPEGHARQVPPPRGRLRPQPGGRAPCTRVASRSGCATP